MNTQHIDNRIKELGALEAQLTKLGTERDAVRKEIFGFIEDEGLTDGYKNDLATVSYVERKSVEIKDEEALLKDLKAQKVVRYYKVVPEQVIPEHTELTTDFTKDVKDGKFDHPAVEVKTATNLSIRFSKAEAP